MDLGYCGEKLVRMLDIDVEFRANRIDGFQKPGSSSLEMSWPSLIGPGLASVPSLVSVPDLVSVPAG